MGERPSVCQPLSSCDGGQDLIEYAFVASFVALAAYAGVTALAGGLTSFQRSAVTAMTGNL
jgi:Flp pilus assembly pilin Flp